jgi:hypothetical protein
MNVTVSKTIHNNTTVILSLLTTWYTSATDKILNMLRMKILILKGLGNLNEYKLRYFINHLIKIFVICKWNVNFLLNVNNIYRYTKSTSSFKCFYHSVSEVLEY